MAIRKRRKVIADPSAHYAPAATLIPADPIEEPTKAHAEPITLTKAARELKPGHYIRLGWGQPAVLVVHVEPYHNPPDVPCVRIRHMSSQGNLSYNFRTEDALVQMADGWTIGDVLPLENEPAQYATVDTRHIMRVGDPVSIDGAPFTISSIAEMSDGNLRCTAIGSSMAAAATFTASGTLYRIA